MSRLIHRMTQTCEILSAPATGESGVTTIASDHLCTVPYPASKETRWLPGMDSIVSLYEMVAAGTADIQDDYTLISNGRTFNIVRAQRWTPSIQGRETFYNLVLEELPT